MTHNWKERIEGLETGEAARVVFDMGYHCSEAVVRAAGLAYLPESDLNDTYFRITGIYQGGVAGTHLSECGVLTGALMVIAARFGRRNLEEDEGLAVELSQRYWKMFKQRFSTSNCTLLREGPPGHEDLTCTEIVVEGTRMLAALLDEYVGNRNE